jgi:ribosomal protein S19E (S16A)
MDLVTIQALIEMNWNFMRVKSGRRMKLITLPISVNRLPRKYGSIDVSQTYGASRQDATRRLQKNILSICKIFTNEL